MPRIPPFFWSRLKNMVSRQAFGRIGESVRIGERAAAGRGVVGGELAEAAEALGRRQLSPNRMVRGIGALSAQQVGAFEGFQQRARTLALNMPKGTTSSYLGTVGDVIVDPQLRKPLQRALGTKVFVSADPIASYYDQAADALYMGRGVAAGSLRFKAHTLFHEAGHAVHRKLGRHGTDPVMGMLNRKFADVVYEPSEIGARRFAAYMEHKAFGQLSAQSTDWLAFASGVPKPAYLGGAMRARRAASVRQMQTTLRQFGANMSDKQLATAAQRHLTRVERIKQRWARPT